MEQKQAFKQMMDLQKAAWDNAFSAMALLQEQAERMLAISLEQAIIMPQEGKKAITEWYKAGKKGGEFFKKTVDDGFQKLESFWAG